MNVIISIISPVQAEPDYKAKLIGLQQKPRLRQVKSRLSEHLSAREPSVQCVSCLINSVTALRFILRVPLEG